MSKQWPRRKEIMLAAKSRLELGAPQGRAVLALAPFGIALGIPAALGLAPGSALAVPGALMACMLGRSLAAAFPSDEPAISLEEGRPGEDAASSFGVLPDRPWGKLDSPFLWAAVLSWSVFVPTIALGTTSVRQMTAVQAVLGPPLLTGGTSVAVALVAATISGLIAAIFWAARTPSLGLLTRRLPADIILRWGEAALAGVAVSAVLTGPALGPLAAAPFSRSLGIQAVLWFGLACFAVSIVSRAGRWSASARPGPALSICFVLSAAAVAAAGWPR